MPVAVLPWKNSQRPLRASRFLALPTPHYPENPLRPTGMPRPKGRLLYFNGLLKKKNFPSYIKERENRGQPSRALLPFLLKNPFPVVIILRRRSFRLNRNNPNNGTVGISFESVWKWRPRLPS